MDLFAAEFAIRNALGIDYGAQGFLTKTVDEGLGVEYDLRDYSLFIMMSDTRGSAQLSFLVLQALLVEALLWERSNSRDINALDETLTRVERRIIDLDNRFDQFDQELVDLISLIEQLRGLVDSFNDLRQRIEQVFNNLNEVLDEIKVEIEFANTSLSEVKARAREYFERRWEDFDNLFRSNLDSWYANFRETVYPVLMNDYWGEFNNVLTSRWENFETNLLPRLLDDFFLRLRNESLDWWNQRKIDILGVNTNNTLTSLALSLDRLNEQFVGVLGALEGISAGVTTIEANLQTLNISVGTVFTEVTGVGVTVGFIERGVISLESMVKGISNLFSPFKPTLYSYFEDKFDNDSFNLEEGLNNYQKKYHDSIVKIIGEGVLSVTLFGQPDLSLVSKTISDEVTSKIVGESYSKWNSVSSFYPSVIFILKEDGDVLHPRRAQIKLRYKKEANDIDESDLAYLRDNVNNFINFKYNYGTIRTNFVSKDKTSKTTIYVNSEKEVIDLLTLLCNYLDIKWDLNDLTFTQGSRRNKITSRYQPLDGIGVDKTNYNEAFRLRFVKVVLLINGLKTPITIFNEDK